MQTPLTQRASGAPVEMRACLGTGGFGEVYLAVREGREVAVKVLHHGLDPRSQAVQRLRDEARLLGLLDHPGILGIEDLVLLDGRVALITEYVDGADLEDLLPPRGDIPAAAGADVLQQVATALQAAYTTIDPRGRPLRLLHRDIKPANLRVARDGRVKLLDFGIAKATGVTREARTQGTSVLGSFAYMAPERFDPRQEDGPAGDVYSLGCVLFEVLAGGAMLLENYEIRDLFSLAMNRVTRDEVIAERVGTLRVPDAARTLLLEMLAWEPSARPDLADAADRLDQVAAHLPGDRLVPWCRARSWPDAPSTPGPLTGRTIHTDAVDRPAQVTTQETLVVHDLDDADTALAEPVQEGRPASSGLLVIGVLGLLGFGVAAVGGTALGWLAMGQGDGVPIAAPPDSVPRPGDPVVPGPVAPAGPAPSGPAPVRPQGPRPGPVPVGDPAPVGSPPDVPVPGPVADPPAVAGSDGTPGPVCADLVALEVPASSGALPPGVRACLDAFVAGSGPLTQRRKAARVLLRDARVRCDRDQACVDYERLMPDFLEHLDQSSPDVLLPWASHLLTTADGRDARLQQADRWARVALENKHVWSGPTRVRNESRLHEIRARAAYARWMADSRSEDRRQEARDRVVAWANHERQIGRDAREAMELCGSVAGEEACGARVNTDAVLVDVVITSRPIQASLAIDGEAVGETPRSVPLSPGTHAVVLTLGESRLEQEIEVGDGKPTRWTWVREDGSWSGSY